MQEVTKRFTKNTLWLILEYLTRIISNLVIGVFIARSLGVENFGSYSYIISWYVILFGINKAGLDDVIYNDLIGRDNPIDSIINNAILVRLAFTVSSICLVGSVIVWTGDNIAMILTLMIILSIPQIFDVIEVYFHSQIQGKKISIIKNLQLFVGSTLKALVIIYNGSFYFLLAIISLEGAISSLLYLNVYKNKGFIISIFKPDFNYIRSLLARSLPLLLSSIVIYIYMRTDQIMIMKFLGPEETGIYSSAIKISEGFYFLPIILSNSIFPLINKHSKSSEESNIWFLRLYSFLIWSAIIIGIILYLTSDSLIILLYGEEFSRASMIVRIHCWSAIFVFIGVAFNKFLVARNLTVISFYRTLAGALVNVVLNFSLIPSYGIAGAAVASLIAQIVSNFIFDLFKPEIKAHFYLKISAFLNPLLILKK